MKRCVFLTSIIWIILSPLVQSTINLDRYKGLKFADDANSYLLFTVDMSPFVNKITVCGWLKNLGSARWPTVFNYGSNNVRFQGDGDYICIRNNCLYLKSQVSVPRDTWTHTCMSWSTSSQTLRYYINGQLVRGMNVGSGSLQTGHQISIGNHYLVLRTHMFGGEMVNLNVYAKELSGEEIKRLSDAGICSTAVDENEDVRVLKWEEILKKPRTGTVTEISVAELCIPETILTRLEEAEQKVQEITEQLSETQRTLETSQQALEASQQTAGESQQALEVALAEKEKIKETLNETKLELHEVTVNLNRTTEELKTALERLEDYNKTSGWDWDMFSLDTYINTTISSDVSEQLHSSWDDIADMMIGFTVTDQSISFWKHIDQCADERPWSVLYSERYINKINWSE